MAMFTQLNASIADYVRKRISIDHRSQLLINKFPLSQTLKDLLGPDSPVGS
jgi:hypothetical protein